MNGIEADVIISGCGPTGALIANLLGKYGISTLVFEKEKEIYSLPRAVVIDDDIARIIQEAELIEKVMTVSPASKGYRFLNQTGTPMFAFKRQSGKSANGYPNSLSIRQPEVEAVFRQGLDRYPHVQLYTEHAVESMRQDKDSVTVSVRDMRSDTVREVRGKYLLASEGGRSVIRKSLGIELHDYKYNNTWLIVDVIAKEKLDLPEMNQQYCNPERPATFIYHGNNKYRWEILLKPDETAEHVLRDETIIEMIKPWIGSNEVAVERKAVSAFHSLMAKRWREGHVFLLGDTAHQMPPFLGQGLSSGLRDAHNLAWKLTMVLNGTAEETLLDSYQSERYPHVDHIVQTAVKLGHIIQIEDQRLADLRDFLFEYLNGFPNAREAIQNLERSSFAIGQGLHDPIHSAANGKLFIQPTVATTYRKGVLLDELLGSRFALIGLNNDPAKLLSTKAAEIMERLGAGFMKVVASEEEADLAEESDATKVIDTDHAIEEWCKAHQAEFVLLRPDRYVFGVYTTDQLEEGIQQLESQLRQPVRTNAS